MEIMKPSLTSRSTTKTNKGVSKTSIHKTKIGKCERPSGTIHRNPYLNFLSDFRQRNTGLSAVETIKRGAKEWMSMAKEDKLQYIEKSLMEIMKPSLTSRSTTKTNKGVSKTSIHKTKIGKCERPSGTIHRNPYLNFLSDFRQRNTGLSAVETIKRGAKEWMSMAKEDKLQYIEKSLMEIMKPSLTSRSTTKTNKGVSKTSIHKTKIGKCERPSGTIHRNPYLNFLSDFRQRNTGLSAVETIKRGAKEWMSMAKEDKLQYIEKKIFIVVVYTRAKLLTAACIATNVTAIVTTKVENLLGSLNNRSFI
ncbi:uncharacterized protein [Eurosta solidaginis]|uniref:uncharacterized protein n=1 Tax=Eurosta solidaginis TaxID=178769 RepID=UPI003530DE73